MKRETIKHKQWYRPDHFETWEELARREIVRLEKMYNLAPEERRRVAVCGECGAVWRTVEGSEVRPCAFCGTGVRYEKVGGE